MVSFDPLVTFGCDKVPSAQGYDNILDLSATAGTDMATIEIEKLITWYNFYRKAWHLAV